MILIKNSKSIHRKSYLIPESLPILVEKSSKIAFFDILFLIKIGNVV